MSKTCQYCERNKVYFLHLPCTYRKCIKLKPSEIIELQKSKKKKKITEREKKKKKKKEKNKKKKKKKKKKITESVFQVSLINFHMLLMQ